MHLAFATATELRDHLLHQLDGSRDFSQPIQRVGRDDSEPVWAWLSQLVKQRSDWHPAIGNVLRHMALREDPWAHIALTDVLAASLHSVALHPYLVDFIPRIGHIAGTASGHNWGFNGPSTAGKVLTAQGAWLSQATDPARGAWLEGEWGPKVSRVSLAETADVDHALRLSARRAKFTWTPWGERLWSWIYFESFAQPRLGTDLSLLVPRLLQGSHAEVLASLDWMQELRDLWRYADALEAAAKTQPWWWSESVTSRPKGWKKSWPHPPHVAGGSLGDVVEFLLPIATAQAARPPIMDLDEIGVA